MNSGRVIFILLLALATTGCELLGLPGLGGERNDPEKRDDGVVPVEATSTSTSLAHLAILDARAEGTGLLLDQLLFSGLTGISTQSLSGNIEAALFTPVGETDSFTVDGSAEGACPFLTPSSSDDDSGLNCRMIADGAAVLSLVLAPSLGRRAANRAMAGKSLSSGEQAFVSAWAQEGALSGIDSGATEVVNTLRAFSMCSDERAPDDRAFRLGEEQGTAFLEETATDMLPTIPYEQCQTDVIAASVLAEARSRAVQFHVDNPICAGFEEDERIGDVNLEQAEAQRQQGFNAGMTAAYEVLRVRLVNTWECDEPEPEPVACLCFARHSGAGPVYCFPENRYSQIPPSSGFILKKMADDGVEQCNGEGTVTKPVGSPLIIDLDDNGITLSARQKIPFDLAANGDIAKIPAIADADALLALDLDGDGRVGSGAELFGNHTRCGTTRCLDGLEALAQHDSNGDGVLDARDPAFERLWLWRDIDANGESGAGELFGLDAVDVVSISLTSRLDLAWVDARGNSAMRALTFTRGDGAQGAIHDVWFSIEFDAPPQHIESARITSTLPGRLSEVE